MLLIHASEYSLGESHHLGTGLHRRGEQNKGDGQSIHRGDFQHCYEPPQETTPSHALHYPFSQGLLG